jgi:predicted acyl esterase
MSLKQEPAAGQQPEFGTYAGQAPKYKGCTTESLYLTMRDGVRLFTAVYVPKDGSQQYPILLNRTPYSIAPYGVDNYPAALGPSELFARDLYIFVNQASADG